MKDPITPLLSILTVPKSSLFKNCPKRSKDNKERKLENKKDKKGKSRDRRKRESERRKRKSSRRSEISVEIYGENCFDILRFEHVCGETMNVMKMM